MKIQNWKINEAKSKKNNIHQTIYFVSKQGVLNTRNDNLTITSQYQGNWKSDMKDGFGDYVYKNGDQYSGQWSKNMRQGNGTIWVMSQRKKLLRSYVGQWANDQKEGRGTMYYLNGDKYEGFWFQNQKCGFVGKTIRGMGMVYFFDLIKRFLKANGQMVQEKGQKKILIGDWHQDTLKTGLYSQIFDEKLFKLISIENYQHFLEVQNPEIILKQQFQLINEMRNNQSDQQILDQQQNNYQFKQLLLFIQ